MPAESESGDISQIYLASYGYTGAKWNLFLKGVFVVERNRIHQFKNNTVVFAFKGTSNHFTLSHVSRYIFVNSLLLVKQKRKRLTSMSYLNILNEWAVNKLVECPFEW